MPRHARLLAAGGRGIYAFASGRVLTGNQRAGSNSSIEFPSGSSTWIRRLPGLFHFVAKTKARLLQPSIRLGSQLDDAGRADAVALGKALRELAIPSDGLSSPTYRALETARLAQLPSPQVAAELGDRGQSMQGVSDADGAWLRSKVLPPSTATNTILITHLPNITRAFPEHASGIVDGDALVFSGDGKGGATMVGVIRIAEWPAFRR